MKKSTMIWLVIGFIVVSFSTYKLYPVTTATRYGVSIDLGKLIRDEHNKRRENILIELGGIEHTREFEPEFFSARPHPKWEGGMDLHEEIYLSALTVKYKNGSEEICWFNYKTGEPELFPEAPPDERMREFIPQDVASQSLYDVYVKQGKSSKEALEKILLIWVKM